MEVDFNMNHHNIFNLNDPTMDAQAATKGYVDTKSLLLTGGAMSGGINMNSNAISGLPTPASNTYAATKGYVDTKSLLLTGGTMTGEIDMAGEKITGLPASTQDSDAVRKEELDAVKNQIHESQITSAGATNVFHYLMENVNESSSESNVEVDGIVDFSGSPHEFNKKAYAFGVTKQADNRFIARLGFNFWQLPEGEYTICFEFFPFTTQGASLNYVSSSLTVNRQASKTFAGMIRSIVHVHKYHISPPEYLMVDMHWTGSASDPAKKPAHLIVYGVAGNVSDVPANVFDSPFAFENQRMVMQTNLDMNGQTLLNAQTKQKTFILARFVKNQNQNYLFFADDSVSNNESQQIFGEEIKINKVTLYLQQRSGGIDLNKTQLSLYMHKDHQPIYHSAVRPVQSPHSQALQFNLNVVIPNNRGFSMALVQSGRGGSITKAKAVILIEF